MIGLLRGLLDLALPPRCAACRAWDTEPLCSACRGRLAPDLEPTRIPHLNACVAAAAYAGDLSDWMQRFKYPRTGFANLDTSAARILGALAEEAALHAPGGAPELVIPVPLHPRRVRSRGFNPSLLLARAVARTAPARLGPRVLKRVRDTPTQTGLGRRARRRNVSGAFVCRRAVPASVWLVDDVVTTGATLSECARVLRQRGARRVVAICVARTPKDDGLRGTQRS